MENWGLVTYGNYYMLIDPELSDIYDYWQVARVISHEQAHMVREKILLMVPLLSQLLQGVN